MGKPKKGRKARQDDDFEDDDFVDPIAQAAKDSEEVETVPTSKGPAKKTKKGGKKKAAREDSDDEEDVSKNLEALAIDSDEDIKSMPMNKKNKKKKPTFTDFVAEDEEDGDDMMQALNMIPTAKSGAAFSMLGMDESGGDDNYEDMEEEEEEKPKPKEEKKVEPAPKPQQKKGKKDKKKKQKDTEDDDIDAILAALEEPTEKQKPSKKDKKKKQDSIELDDEEDQAPAEDGEKPSEVPEKKQSDDVKEPSPGTDDMETEEQVEEKSTVKTAAQKKKEKKEREKAKKQKEKEQQKQKKAEKPAEQEVKPEETENVKEPSPEVEDNEGAKGSGDEDDDDDDSKKKKKDKKKKKKGEKEEEEKGKKKSALGKAKLKAMQEALQKLKEEEERMEREEQEAEKRAEQNRLAKLEKEKLEKEKKDKTKQKKKEREQRLKAEGKWLSDKQKKDRQRALQMLELMKQQGVEVPGTDDQPPKEKKRVVYDHRKKKQQQKKDGGSAPETPTPTEEKEIKFTPEVAEEKVPVAEKKVEEDDVKDAWDASSDEETQEDEKTVEKESEKTEVDNKKAEEEDEDDDDEEEESEEESEEDEDSEEESEDDSDDQMTSAEKARYRAQTRIEKRQEKNEKNRTTDVLRAPVVCVLGHVDTGKTKILDKLRRTHVQDGEAGGITQQIGATNVPIDAIKEATKMCKEFHKGEIKVPGLLIIDTPGHESFSNLRSRGSSLCDIAILVVDIMHGLEPQTIESINLLKQRKTPFVVALNKVDRLFQWKSSPHSDIQNTIKKQAKNTKDEFDERAKETMLQFAEQGLNATLFYENKDPRVYISMVPTSAHSGDGMGNLMALICELCQTMLAKRLAFSEELQATTMEVKALPGLGTTVDVILVNGRMREGNTIILAGTDGPIVTQVRGLLMPQPMKELRVKNQYMKHKEVVAAQGIKIIAKDLEKGLAGLPLYVANHPDEIELLRDEVSKHLRKVLSSIKLSERGVYVQASTLGSLEALLEYLKSDDVKVPYSGISIGPVHKKDVMKASVMLEHDQQYAVILAFDVKVEREAQEMADSVGLKIFTADIIYHLFDKFTDYREQFKQKKKDENRLVAVFPTKLRVLPQFIFNSRDPIVVGVSVEAGVVKEGTPLCVPTKDCIELGRVTSIESNHKNVDSARKGMEVCIKIEPLASEAPKMYGRHFDHEDLLMSKITRESIDALKECFRDEMQKSDWQLVVELKKMYGIL